MGSTGQDQHCPALKAGVPLLGALAVSIATMRALEKQIKVLDKAIEQQFVIIPNTLISVPGIGKV